MKNIKVKNMEDSIKIADKVYNLMIEPEFNWFEANDSEVYRLSIEIRGSEDVKGDIRFKYTHHKGQRTPLTTYSKRMNIDEGRKKLEVIYDTMQSTTGQSIYLKVNLDKGQVILENWKIERLQRYNILKLPKEIEINKDSLEIPIELKKDEGENKDPRLLWISSNEEIVKVRKGILIPKQAGNAEITVMTKDRIIRHSCKVFIKENLYTDQEVEKIDFLEKQREIEVNRTIDLKPSILPQGLTTKKINWESSDEEIASVINGRVTGRKEGKVIIIARGSNEVSKECCINVIAQKKDCFNDMRVHWLEKCLGETRTIEKESTMKEWIEMDKNNSREGLWYEPTVTKPRVWPSDKINKDVSRLRDMTILAMEKSLDAQENEQLIYDIVKAIVWIYENYFGPNNFMEYTWWQWEIGIPHIINEIVLRLHSYFTEEEIHKVMGYIHNELMPYPEYMEYIAGGRIVNTGANLMDQIKTAFIPAIFMKDGKKIEKCKNLLLESLKEVSEEDGFYKDGSFVQHLDVAYTGSYGAVYLNSLTEILEVLSGTEYELSKQQAKRVYFLLEESYFPLLHKGRVMDMVKGRAIVRKKKENEQEYGVLINIIRLSYMMEEPYKLKMLSKCKYMMEQILSIQKLDIKNLYIRKLIKNLIEDEGIKSKSFIGIHKEYGGMNRTIHHEKNFIFGVSKSSKRIKTYEVTNFENQKGWHTGDGMTYLYNDDWEHYEKEYWVTIDWNRLPGVTADPYRIRNWGTASSGDAQGRPENIWSGGVTFEKRFGSSGMQLRALNGKMDTDLRANKSWFIFDDVIVALGSGINNTNNRMIETTVEQRCIRGDNLIAINGEKQPKSWEGERECLDVSWIYLEGNRVGSEIGYYFPSLTTIKVKCKEQEGNYHEISVNGDKEIYKNNFFTVWIPHGLNPNNEKYAYGVLPGKSIEEIETYSQIPSFEILVQDDTLHAVRHLSHDLLAIHSFDQAIRKIGNISLQGEIACMIQQKGNELKFAIADPTMNQDKVIIDLSNITLKDIIACDKQIRVYQIDKNIRIITETKGSLSQSFEVKFKINESRGIYNEK